MVANSSPRLMSIYGGLHSSMHSPDSPQLSLLHTSSTDMQALAWRTRDFELYAVAGPNVSREALLQGVYRLKLWVDGERDRLFVYGNGKFRYGSKPGSGGVVHGLGLW